MGGRMRACFTLIVGGRDGQAALGMPTECDPSVIPV
jgi:hypothetical protein